MNKKIAIIGAGIMGLLQALLLKQAGWDVTIFTNQDPLKTTTIAAGAIWMPYLALPEDKVLIWAKHSLDYYKEMATLPISGVYFTTHTEILKIPQEKPAWMNLVSEGLPPDCQFPIDAIAFHSVYIPIIDTYRLVSYLLNLLKELRVNLIEKNITNFLELLDYRMIVNVAGVGAGKLAGDPNIYPIKGQTFTITQPTPRLTQSVFFDDGNVSTLVVPHPDHVTIGITWREHDYSLNYELAEEEKLLQSASTLYPNLLQSEILTRRVGLRPGRMGGIRLTEEYLSSTDQWIFHNYGHAGGGITLAPGCAHDLLGRIENVYSA